MNADLVRRVNQLLHNQEAYLYDAQHPEIWRDEQRRWRTIFSRFLPATPARTLVDIGSGTGFVGMMFREYFSQDDAIVCADISEEMLVTCTNRLVPLFPAGALRTVLLIDERLPFVDASIDVVTLNSVLHHIPQYQDLLSEIVRILKPGGVMIMDHEPNKRYVENSFLRLQDMFLQRLKPMSLVAGVLRKCHFLHQLNPSGNDLVLDNINQTLLSEGLIVAPLNRQSLSALVDIHSFSAGGLHMDRGFSTAEIMTICGSQMTCVFRETYGHLGKFGRKRSWVSWYASCLRLFFPRDGSQFSIVLQKSSVIA